MTSMRRIVAATDFSPGSEAAVERAVQLAAAHGASLCLLHAFDASAWHSLMGAFDAQRLSADPPLDVRMRQRLVDAAAALASQAGLEVEAQFGVGSPESTIDSYVRAHAVSLAVVGSRADPEVAGLGSTASKVVRAPACPVLIVRAPGSRPYDTVLSAVDLREGSIRAVTFALTLFPAARHHLLYALDPALDRAVWMGVFAKEQLQSLHESMHARADRELQQFAQSLRARALHPLTADVADDLPARAILVGAAALPADCVVVGHHGEGTVVDSFLGNLAQHVIQYTTRDVLVVP
ncbi:MAG: universal stress protein [Rubrivivax sp.]|nr:universal stress protein [Rubrivivax sp.]